MLGAFRVDGPVRLMSPRLVGRKLHTDVVNPGNGCIESGLDRSSSDRGWIWNWRSGVLRRALLKISRKDRTEMVP